MDAKTKEVLEELKLKNGEGRITEDQICPKCGGENDSYSQGVYEGNSVVLCMPMPTTACFVKKLFKERLGVQSAAK